MTRHRIVTSRRLGNLHGRLTDEDWAVLNTLHKLRVATGLQLQLVHHGEDEAARFRRIRQLTRLSRMQVITRLENRVVGGIRGGSVSGAYVLDVAGLRLLDPSGIARRPWQPSSPFVAHAVAVTQVYVDLVAADRAGAIELIAFDAEPKCWRHYSDRHGDQITLKPDADVTVGVGEFEHHSFLEVDRATESRPRITRKGREYVDYYATGIEQGERGVTPQVVFSVPTERRKALVVDALRRLDADHWHLFGVCVDLDTVSLLSGQSVGAGR